MTKGFHLTAHEHENILYTFMDTIGAFHEELTRTRVIENDDMGSHGKADRTRSALYKAFITDPRLPA